MKNNKIFTALFLAAFFAFQPNSVVAENKMNVAPPQTALIISYISQSPAYQAQVHLRIKQKAQIIIQDNLQGFLQNEISNPTDPSVKRYLFARQLLQSPLNDASVQKYINYISTPDFLNITSNDADFLDSITNALDNTFDVLAEIQI